MKFEFKILYKDESGNLDLGKNIGKCYLYVFNDADLLTPRFWVISKNKKLIIDYSLDNLNFNLDYYCIYHNKYTNKSINLLKEDQKKIFDYIIGKDDIKHSIWFDMINAHDSYYGVMRCFRDSIDKYINDRNVSYDTYIYKDIDLGDRLGECSLEVTNIFPSIGTILIRSKKIGFNTLISLYNGDYIGLDKLTNDECVILYNFMNSKNDHFGTHKMWYELISNSHLSDYYLTKRELSKFFNIITLNTDLEYVPRFDICANKSSIIDTESFKNKLKEIIGGH